MIENQHLENRNWIRRWPSRDFAQMSFALSLSNVTQKSFADFMLQSQLSSREASQSRQVPALRISFARGKGGRYLTDTLSSKDEFEGLSGSYFMQVFNWSYWQIRCVCCDIRIMAVSYKLLLFGKFRGRKEYENVFGPFLFLFFSQLAVQMST